MFITNKHNVNGQPGEIDMLVYQLNQLQNFPSVCCSTTEHTEYTEKTRVSQLCDSVCPVYSEVLKLPQLYGLTDEEIAIVGGTNDGKSGDAAKTDDGEGAAATQGGGGRDGARPKRRSGRRSLRRSFSSQDGRQRGHCRYAGWRRSRRSAALPKEEADAEV